MTKSFDEILSDFPEFHAVPRPSERIPEILALLQDAWELTPDQRFFQLLSNIFETENAPPLSELFYQEDDRTSQRLIAYLTERKIHGS